MAALKRFLSITRGTMQHEVMSLSSHQFDFTTSHEGKANGILFANCRFRAQFQPAIGRFGLT